MFVGAGYAGLEGLIELQDYAANIVDLYPRCRMQGPRWIMIEAAERVLPEISADLANFAVRELQRRGIEIRTDTTVEEVGDRRVQLSDGTEVVTRNVVWTAGVRAHPVVEQLGLPLERGRIKADRFLRVEGQENVWAIGDCTAVPDPARKGRVVAKNVAAVLGTGRMQPFNYKTLGAVVDMGRNQAVASTLGLKWRGLPAWFLTRGYHLVMMPSAKRKLRLMGDWTTDLLFGLDRVSSPGYSPVTIDGKVGG